MSSSAGRWSIHVVAWNEVAALSDFLSSVDQQEGWSGQVIVMDNASTMGVSAWLAGHWPDVIALRNFRDMGWARAHNQAMALALSRWPKDVWADRFVAFTHPDVLWEPHALKRLEEAFAQDKNLMMTGPKVLRARASFAEDGEQREVEFTDVLESVGWVRKHWKQRPLGQGETDKGQHDGVTSLPSPVCCVVRASALPALQANGKWFEEKMDERQNAEAFFRRGKRLGYVMRTVPDAVIWHHAHGAEALDKSGLLDYKRWYRILKNG